jgi:hypothetical protein
MSLNKGTKISRGYATISNDDGVNYRKISQIMSEIGFKMNHSSARNNVLHVMRKFAKAIMKSYKLSYNEKKLDEIIKMPSFQKSISEILQNIEDNATTKEKNK